MIRPIEEGSGFDVDLVCRLDMPKESTTQADLKAIVGDRLEDSGDFRHLLSERRRCWTLDYPPQFHLDVLPAIPDADDDHDILITDTDLLRWQFSNPKNYSKWFFGQMNKVLTEAKAAMAKSLGVSIEDVPEWRVRTPLQRAVQLLKRHRDVLFKHDDERRPVSIIITTLAASAYDGERDIETALIQLIRKMPNHIEKRNGKWWVANPAHPDENFADKWNENQERREAFVRWLGRVLGDLAGAPIAKSAAERRNNLAESFGIRRHPGNVAMLSKSVPTVLLENVPALSGINHVLAPKWPQRQMYDCSVNGHVYRKYRGKRPLWALSNDQPVSKGCGLRFRAQTNTPPPFDVQWQVTNTGREASDDQGLRGDFYVSDDGSLGEHQICRHSLGRGVRRQERRLLGTFGPKTCKDKSPELRTPRIDRTRADGPAPSLGSAGALPALVSRRHGLYRRQYRMKYNGIFLGVFEQCAHVRPLESTVRNICRAAVILHTQAPHPNQHVNHNIDSRIVRNALLDDLAKFLQGHIAAIDHHVEKQFLPHSARRRPAPG
jgi:hypothetical protein